MLASSLILSLWLAQPAGLTPPPAPSKPWVQVQVNVEPRTLPAGGATARVEVTYTDSAGNPVDAEDARIQARAGALEDLQRTGKGTYTARYRAPETSTPSIDVIQATEASSGALGWSPIRLTAKASIPVQVDQPGAEVTVDFAGKTFGPVQADAQGWARFELTVPPGNWTLTVRAMDANGNETVTSQKLPLPRYDRVWVEAATISCAPGGHPGGWVDVVLATPSGRPARGVEPKVQAKNLVLSESVELAPGHRRYAFVTEPGPEREETILARYAGRSALATVEVGAAPDVGPEVKARFGESEKAMVETRAHITTTYELLDRAREHRDLVLLRCVQQKLTRMKTLARVSERAHESMRRDLSECRGDAVVQGFERVDGNRNEIKKLAAEAEACLGVGDSLAARTDIDVTGPEDGAPDLDALPPPDDYVPPPAASPYH